MKRISFAIMVGITFLFSIQAKAKIIYSGAKIYDIAEMPMDKYINIRLQQMIRQGKWQKLISKPIKLIQQTLISPKSDSNISETKKSKIFYYNPTVIMPKRIVTPQGNLLVAMNTKFNPLSKIKLDETLLFYNANDPKQVCWAKKMQNKVKGVKKWILVSGNWKRQSKLLKTRVYFDQQGKICHQLSITHTPAIVSQDGLRLKIQEVLPCKN